MTAVRAVLKLLDLAEVDGEITALDSYGKDTHVGTSYGHLLRLTVSINEPALLQGSSSATSGVAPYKISLGDAGASQGNAPVTTFAFSAEDAAVSTTVSSRCTVSSGGGSVQQLQHSRTQRLLFVLCEGRLHMLNAETYTLLSTIAVDVASFSVAPPALLTRQTLSGDPTRDAGASTSHTRVHSGTARHSSGNRTHQHSRAASHLPTPSEGSCGSTSTLSPRGGNAGCATASHLDGFTNESGSTRTKDNLTCSPLPPPSLPSLALPSPPSYSHAALPSRPGGASGKVHVVCVAEKNMKSLAVYAVDRVSLSKAVRGTTGSLVEGNSTVPLREVTPAAPPPGIVLLQRYILPEPALSVLVCDPAPILRHACAAPLLPSIWGPPGNGVPAMPIDSVEAGLTVCIGMRREVSLLSLRGGPPWCVLRLDGSRPPLLSVGNDHNVFFIRTQAPNTVMEVGVPPAAASAGLVPQDLNDDSACVVNPITLRMDPLQRKMAASSVRSVLAAGSRDRENELIMGDVFQADAAVQLVLSRFPFVFLFTADHCEVVSLLHNEPHKGTTEGQRLPLPNILHGAMRGQGAFLSVASKRTVWMLHLNPLRVQLAQMVTEANYEGALRLLAFHHERVAAHSERAGGADDTAGASRALRAVEVDLYLMAGFTCLHRGDIPAAIGYLRRHVDPRDVLVSLPECVPPCSSADDALRAGTAHAVCEQPRRSASRALDIYVLDSVVMLDSADDYDDVLNRSVFHDEDNAESEVQPCPPFWEGWKGPCIYNSYAGRLPSAWRAALASPRAPGIGALLCNAADDDSAIVSCFDILKMELRKWFAQELLSDVSSYKNLQEEDATEAFTVPAGLSWTECAEGHEKVLSLQGTMAPFTSAQRGKPLAAQHRRAMEYASLVLAWEARDYCVMYRLIASVGQAFHVEDCEELLRHLQEHRLLALLYFRGGRGEACRYTLRRHVSIAASPELYLGHRGDQRNCGVPHTEAFLQAEQQQWRRCMMVNLEVGDRQGMDDPEAPLPVCGRGFLMLPSLPAVARVAHTIFNIEGELCSQRKDQGTVSAKEELLDSIANHYIRQRLSSTATPGRVGVGLCELHFSTSKKGLLPALTLPHMGPLFTSQEEAAAGNRALHPPNGGDCQQERQQDQAVEPLRPFLRVVPSVLCELFYLVEKLDILGVKRLLGRQPWEAQLRSEDGDTALHVLFAQLRMVGACCADRDSRKFLHEAERAAAARHRMTKLQLVCALSGILVHYGCPVGAVNRCGWSCLDVAALLCASDFMAFDVVTAALLASIEARSAATPQATTNGVL